MSLIQNLFARIAAFRTPSTSRPTRRPAWLSGAAALAAAVVLAVPALGAISNLRVDFAFSPNGDGVRDLGRIGWTRSTPTDSVRIEIRPSAQGTIGPYLVAFTRGAQPAGTDTAFWDGRDSAGVAQPEGLYGIYVHELTAAGVRVPNSFGTALIRLDVTPPPTPSILEGFDGRDTTSATLRAEGIAPEADSAIVFSGGVPVDTVQVSTTDSSFVGEAPLVEGLNAIAAQSFDRAGNVSPLSPAVTVRYRNTADILAIAARPFYVSPNGDGVLDTASVFIRLDAPTTRLLVQVRKSVPYLTGFQFADSLEWVRILHDGPQDAGDVFIPWDGRDSTGADVPDGSWFYFAQAESADAAGNPLPGLRRYAFTVIDRTAPPVPELDPAPATRTTRNFVTFTGTTGGLLAQADTILVWRDGVVVGRSFNEVRWEITAPLTLGPNTFYLAAADRAGNRSPLGSPLTILYEEPMGFHAPERFRATDVFDVNVARTARSVRIDLYELGGRRVRTLLVQQFGQRYELPWDVTDDRGVTVGDGPYVARVTVTYDDGVVETRSGAIVVAK